LLSYTYKIEFDIYYKIVDIKVFRPCPSSTSCPVNKYFGHIHYNIVYFHPRSQQAIGPVARLLRSWVRIPPGAWIFVCCECRVLSGRGLCDELITHPEESYRLCCVVVCDLETSRMGAPYIYIYIYIWH